MPSHNNTQYLKNCLRQFEPKLLLRALAMPTMVATAQDVARIFATPKPPTKADIDATYQRLLQAFNSNTLHDVAPRDWQMTAYVLWYGAQNLGAQPKFLQYYLEWLTTQNSPARWRAFIWAYLRYFEQRQTFTEAFATMARAIQTALKNAILSRLGKPKMFEIFC